MRNAYIISLKFTPGLKKEFEVLGENIRKKGINVKYLISEQYAKFRGKYLGVEYVTKSDSIKRMILDTIRFIDGKKVIQIFSGYPPIFLCFYNPHPLNVLIAKIVKSKFPTAIICLYLHESHVPNKKPYGRVKAAYIYIGEFIQRLTIKYSQHIIFPSDYSSHLFKKKYPKFKGKTHIAPLLVPDQKVSRSKRRRFFSMVGAAHQATGHDTFVELLNHVAARRLGYEFALISSSDVSKYLGKLNAHTRKTLKLINRKIITDFEINEVIRESYAVFRLDREVTQSGVIPVSYMNATPVISRDIPGLTQHVIHGENGYVVSLNCKLEEMVEAMRFVKNNFSYLSETARKSYEQIWAEWNWDRYYSWLSKMLIFDLGKRDLGKRPEQRDRNINKSD